MLEIIKNQWSEAAWSKRIGFAIGLVMVFALLIVGTLWALHDDYQILFSELNPQDASAMVNELDRLKTPYRLADNGTTILVERDSVYKTRLKLMGKGLNLQGAVGFEIFNNAEFGMTEFAQKVNYQRALQGELARTIMGFEEVKSARVHLVLPESGLFKRSTAKPKASVSIITRADSTLSEEQVIGIQRLVSASVPEISPSEVTVLNQRGMAVSKQTLSEDSDDAKVHARLETKSQLEEYMTRKVVAVLDKAIGPGKAIVSVDVALNYDQVKVLKEDVIPLANTSGQEVGAIARRKETTQGNVWLYESASQNKLGANTPASSSVDVEFTNSRQVEQVLSSPGSIFKLNVGVLLPDMGDKVKLEKLKEVIAMAAGINLKRGDGLAVYSIDLPMTQTVGSDAAAIADPSMSVPSLQHENPKKTGFAIPMQNWLLWVLAGGAILLLLVMAIGKRNANAVTLTREERDRVLEEIMHWSKQASAGGVK